MTSQTITTAGPGIFTVPEFVSSLTIEAWGGGAGGSGVVSAQSPGGGGGGYSLAVISVNQNQAVFYNVGSGGLGATSGPGPGGTSWINPSFNSQPSANGVVAAGGTAGDSGDQPGGVGTVGTTNFTGGSGAHAAGGGGGGAGSAGNGGNGTAVNGPGGSGGTPDGGAGGAGQNGTGTNGTAPGGGGGGSSTSVGGNGAAGQIRFTWTASPPFGPLVDTTLTAVPGKAFTKKHYQGLLEDIRNDMALERELLGDLDEKGRAAHEYDAAQKKLDEYEKSLFGNVTYGNYGKLAEAKEGAEQLRRARDHHYFMEIVNKEWAKHNESKKK